MHEPLHAYLYAKGTPLAVHHEDIAVKYVTAMANSLQTMFPNLPTVSAKNLSLGGLWMTEEFKRTVASDMGTLGSYDADQAAYSTGPAGSHCTAE